MRAALLALVSAARAMPPWSWDTLQTYVHCANLSGAWSDAAIARMGRGAFVVFEKNHALFAPPAGTGAEEKIAAACRAVRATSSSTHCYMYTESDWARTWFDLGRAFDAHPAWELRADARPGAPLVTTTEEEKDDAGALHSWTFRAYDFSVPAAAAAWVARAAGAVAAGAVDGVLIDGNRGGWRSSVLAGASDAHAAAWAAGLNASHRALAAAVAPRGGVLISNYPTDDALAVCGGGMVERGGAGADDVRALQAAGRGGCGPARGPCLVDFHAQYAEVAGSATFNATIAAFLAGAERYAYYGKGKGWEGSGEAACATWLEWPREFSAPLGAPAGAAAEPEPGVFTRAFATGTHVFANTTKGGGHCVWWSDGTTTGDAATCATRAAWPRA